MKIKLLTVLTLVILMFAQCRKENMEPAPDAKTLFTQKAKTFLQQQITSQDFAALDWGKVLVYTQQGTAKTIRIPLLGNTNALQPAVNLTYNGSSFTGNYSGIVESPLAGNIFVTTSLDKQKRQEARLTADGRISSYKNYEQGRMVFDSELIATINMAAVVAYFRAVDGNQYLWISNSGGGGQSGWAVGYEPNNSQSTQSYVQVDGDQNQNALPEGEIINIEYDLVETRAAIDIGKYLKCFTNIPDSGAKFEVSLFSSSPVSEKPLELLNWSNGSPGHTFLRLKKTSSSGQIVQQVFGFYPNRGWASMLYVPVESVMVDDASHSFNASIDMKNLSAAEFQTVIEKAKELSLKKYLIQGFNCTAYALEVFNSVRPNNPINIAMLTIPGAPLLSTSHTPQALFAELYFLKHNNAVLSPSITIPGYIGIVGPSDGPCN